uniref:Calponin-homology (CH) domain-containing protein n=1 Tax=Seriola dumerili TaxID=41447 RepID=A0A3B4TXC6_SERDU
MALHLSEQQIVLKTGQKVKCVTFVCDVFMCLCVTVCVPCVCLSSFPGSGSVSGETSRDEDVSPDRRTLTNLGIPEFPAANSVEGLYHQNVLLAVERWFSLFGWPGGPNPICVPHTLRRSVVDMLHHLTGTQIPGIPRCQTFSSDKDQRTNQLLQQHDAMLAFLRSDLSVTAPTHTVSSASIEYSSAHVQVLVLVRVSVSGLNMSPIQEEVDEVLPVNSQPLVSNVYSACELQLLSWLNKHYESMRKTVWGGVPSARWIVNFDLDLTDGLVLAALLAAYCPYLICSHFRRMYTAASSLEQILHNNIIMVQSLTALSLNIDIQVKENDQLTAFMTFSITGSILNISGIFHYD